MQINQVESGYYPLPYSQTNWPIIKSDLQKIQSSKSMEQTVSILLKFHQLTRVTSIKKFDQLFKVPQAQAIKVFSNIAQFVLQNEEYYSQNPKIIPLFIQHINFSHTFNKRDVVLIMCIVCLCISTPASQINKKFKTRLTYETDPAGIYSLYKRKIPFLINYFQCVFQELKKGNNDRMTISRLKLPSLRQKDIAKMESPLIEIEIENNQSSLDDWNQDLRAKVDFANKYIGGGTLNRGCVQQEIMFLNHTEACISRLLCDPMLDNQAIGLHGFKKYFKNTGYSTTTQFDGLENYKYTLDEKNRLNDLIIAIDALDREPIQYSVQNILREINKARIGFSLFDEEYKISTGNWGCGAFKGDVQLKFVIQWISASIVNRKLVYYPYGNNRLTKVNQIVRLLKDQSVNTVFKAIIQYNVSEKTSVFSYLIEVFRPTKQ